MNSTDFTISLVAEIEEDNQWSKTAHSYNGIWNSSTSSMEQVEHIALHMGGVLRAFIESGNSRPCKTSDVIDAFVFALGTTWSDDLEEHHE